MSIFLKEKYEVLKKGGIESGKYLWEALKGKKGWGSVALYSGLGLYATKVAIKLRRKMNEKSFKGKKVVVTGGANGIGKIMAELLCQEEAEVIILDYDKKNLEAVVEELGAKYKTVQVTGYLVDLSKRKYVYECCKKLLKKFKYIDALINNAGIVMKKRIIHSTDEEIDRVMNVNVNSHMWLIKSFLPVMMKRNEGHIVCVSSVAGIGGSAGLNTYCASKFAAFGLHESLRLQMKNERRNIDVLIVCPYYMNTGMFDGIDAGFFQFQDPMMVSKKIIQAMKDRVNFLVIPDSLRKLAYFLRLTTPCWVQDEVQRVLGTLSAMDEVMKDKEEMKKYKKKEKDNSEERK